jgi:membrane protein YdbS with pleckstrin-like domain
MECPGCHKSIADDSRFCQYCGVPIDAKDAAHVPDAPAAAHMPRSAAATPLDPATEKPLREFRPAWRAFVGGWVLWALATFVLIWLGAKIGDPVWWKVIWALIAAGAAAVFVRQALAVLGIRYRMTTQRLFIDRGLITRTTDQTELIRVDDVRVSQGVIDRVLNIGNVEVVSTDATNKELVIRGIDNAAAIAEDIRLHTRRVRSQRTLYVENV